MQVPYDEERSTLGFEGRNTVKEQDNELSKA